MTIDRQLTDNEVSMLDNVPFRLGVGLQFPVETVEVPLGQWLKNLYERAQVGSFFSLAVGGGPTGAVSSTSESEPLTISSGLTPDPAPTSGSTVSTTITSSIPAGSPQPILTVSTATTDAFTLDAAGLLAISDLVLKQKPDGSRFIYIKDVVTVNVNSSPLVVRSGKGGPGDATLAGGLGGNIVISAGAGGDGSAAQLAANGGSVYVNGGSSGFDLGGGAAAGGSVYLDAGTGGTNNGDVVIGVTLAQSVLLGGATTKLSFFGAVAANQPNAGGSITNNITAGGTADTFVNYTDLTTYATDAATIRNNLYQVVDKLKKIDDALRLLGIVV
jgi:hypothetical protein